LIGCGVIDPHLPSFVYLLEAIAVAKWYPIVCLGFLSRRRYVLDIYVEKQAKKGEISLILQRGAELWGRVKENKSVELGIFVRIIASVAFCILILILSRSSRRRYVLQAVAFCSPNYVAEIGPGGIVGKVGANDDPTPMYDVAR
jgi:hypothetical protein